MTVRQIIDSLFDQKENQITLFFRLIAAICSSFGTLLEGFMRLGLIWGPFLSPRPLEFLPSKIYKLKNTDKICEAN